MAKSKFNPTHRKAFDKYGSSMGRRSAPLSDFAGLKGVRLFKVALDRGGYDKGGAYWGTPNNLYMAWGYNDTDLGDEVVHYLRAASREAAKAKFPASVKWAR